ncbi:MAG: hypothetical protein SVK08_02455 [Halobacteriota archaeon]|nr:hypothetical protein [Halobacteriota archaeon]
MMRKYEVVQVKQRQIVEKTCSVCGMDLMADEFENQESVSFINHCGYKSVFGDGREVYIDLCQHCFKKILGKYCTIT